MEKIKSLFTGPRIIFVILGVVILVELIYAAKVLVFTQRERPPLPQSQTAVKQVVGRLSLNAPKTAFAVNEVVPVSVLVNSGAREINGVDLILRYDPQILEATPAGITEGKIFDDYPFKDVDKSKGLISISGISSLNKSFKGAGDFAIINLRAKKIGNTLLTIDFQLGATTATNLVEVDTSKNILELIDNLELSIQ